MQIPQIKMQSQSAQIAIQTTRAVQSIKQPKATQHIEQPKADMNIRTIRGKLTIDQTKAWEDMNLKHVFRQIEETAQKGKQAALEGVARVAAEGDEMLNIHTGQDVYVEQAKRHANPPPADFNITWMPSPFSVKTHYEPGKTNIQAQARKPVINANVHKPVISYQPGGVHISLKQRNHLQVDFVK